jgi:hypothetical protein
MWTEIEKYSPLFENAVLNSSDGEGYPYSVRCRPEQDRPAGVLRIDLPGTMNVQAGPASLLFHSHDEKLWNQKIFLLRGSLEKTDKGHAFRPEKFVPSIGTGGPLGTVRMVLGMRKATAAYLDRRNLVRPRIPWGEIAALKEKS